MPARPLCFVLIAALASACASAPDQSAPANPAKEESGSKAAAAEKKPASPAKLTQLRHGVEVARIKLEKARMDASLVASDNATNLDRAKVELELAARRFEHFLKSEKPNKIAETLLQLQAISNYYDEAVEELQQLELMYKGDELGDMTKEIVIRRAKRQLERSKTNLEITKESTRHTIEDKLPLEEQRLRFELTAKETELKRAERQGREAEGDKRIGVLEAESSLLRAETELAEAEKGGS